MVRKITSNPREKKRERERESVSEKIRHADVRYNFSACCAEGIELAHDRCVWGSCARILLHLVGEARGVSWLPLSFGMGERLGQGGSYVGRHTNRVITQLFHIDIWFYNASTSGRQHEGFVSRSFLSWFIHAFEDTWFSCWGCVWRWLKRSVSKGERKRERERERDAVYVLGDAQELD